MYIKVHKTYRNVVAVSDAEIIGKKYEEGIRVLDLNEKFYKGEVIESEELLMMMKDLASEDSTFNIAGAESVRIALKAGIISSDGIKTIKGIPYALSLL